VAGIISSDFAIVHWCSRLLFCKRVTFCDCSLYPNRHVQWIGAVGIKGYHIL